MQIQNTEPRFDNILSVLSDTIAQVNLLIAKLYLIWYAD